MLAFQLLYQVPVLGGEGPAYELVGRDGPRQGPQPLGINHPD